MAGNRRKLQDGFRAQESRTLANLQKKNGEVCNRKRSNGTHPDECSYDSRCAK